MYINIGIFKIKIYSHQQTLYFYNISLKKSSVNISCQAACKYKTARLVFLLKKTFEHRDPSSTKRLFRDETRRDGLRRSIGTGV